MATRTKKRKRSNSTQVAFTRFMLIVGFFTIWILGISVRLVHLQVTQHESLKEKAVNQRQDIKKSKILRGTIYDRDDRALAMSIKVKTLYADATEIAEPSVTAKSIAKTLKLDANQLTKQLTDAKAAKKRFVPLVKKVDEETVQKLNKALAADDVKKADEPKFEGLHWAEDQMRSYPYGPLAAQIIGFSNAEDTGMAGIEQSQDDILHGAVIRKMQERDRLGRIYDETFEERTRPGDIALTISTSFQFKVEQALEQGVKASNAKSGIAIAMLPKTGEIIAMANYPTFDPNTIKTVAPGLVTNHAIQSSYSPGSVMKLVTYGSGLEKNLFTPDDMIDSGNGTITIAKRKFADSHGVGSVTYSRAMAISSNVCAIKTGMSVGKDDFYSMLQKMGFGGKTGIELPAETSGILRSPEKWYGDSLASMSIGYEIGVTALQMTSAFATIANDGIKVKPRIIKEIRPSGESRVPSNHSENTRIVSVETARHLRTMLREVVVAGTGKRAQLNGYTSSGKTGTAWKFNSVTKSVDSSKYVSSFIGMAPADNPEIVIAVIIDEPKGGARDGGGVAAPVFKNIAEQILPELGIAQDGPALKEVQVAKDIPAAPPAIDKKDPKTEKAIKSDDKTAAAAKNKAIEPPRKTKEVKKEPEKKPGNGKKVAGNTSAGLLRNKASTESAET